MTVFSTFGQPIVEMGEVRPATKELSAELSTELTSIFQTQDSRKVMNQNQFQIDGLIFGGASVLS